MAAEPRTAAPGRPTFGLLTDIPRVIERHALLKLLKRQERIVCAPVPIPPDGAPLRLGRDSRGDVIVNDGDDMSSSPTVTVALISDTHNRHAELTELLPPPGVAHILIHAGDFTNNGTLAEVTAFADWISSDAVRHRFDATVVIAGNHDVRMDPRTADDDAALAASAEAIAVMKRACDVYLCHEEAAAPVCGLRIFGSPFQPASAAGFAFPFSRQEGHERWRGVYEGADGVDVWVTHGPPLGHGDVVHPLGPMGCADLLDAVESMRAPPLLHVFGHIHSGRGVTAGRRTVFVNAASVGPGRADLDDDDSETAGESPPPRPLSPPILCRLPLRALEGV